MASETNNIYRWEAPDEDSTVAKVVVNADIAKRGSQEDFLSAHIEVCFHYADVAKEFMDNMSRNFRKTMEEAPTLKSLKNGQTQVKFSTALSDACKSALQQLANDHDLPRSELVLAERKLALDKGITKPESKTGKSHVEQAKASKQSGSEYSRSR